MVGHRYTPEEHQFLRDYIPGHTYKEIVAAYNEKFSEPITASRVKGYMANHKINNGLTGRFKKGHIPVNKGKKGVCHKGCEKTWFKKGHIPVTHRPVGSERVNVDGYIEIKIAEPNIWRLKHRIIYEEYYGKIPEGHAVIFLDQNKLNCDIANLKLIPRAELATMCKLGLFYDDADLTVAGNTVAKLVSEARKAKRKEVKRNAKHNNTY